MNHCFKFIITLFTALLLCLPSAANSEHIMYLHAEMLRLISSNDRDQFFQVTEELKKAAQESGNLRLFYIAWGNEAVFEATKQNYSKAFDIVQELLASANEDHNVFGEYMAMHTKAVVQLQKQDYIGMGLSICQAIMKLLRGRIWLDDTYQMGACFCFEIPTK